MNINNISKIARNLAIFTFAILLIQSCKKPENSVGENLLGGELFETGIFRNSKILAFTSQQEKVITSNSSNSLFGVYQDPSFGNIKATAAAQLRLSKISPSFGTNPIIDSVVLTLPYMGKEVGDSILVFDNDSIYGNYDLPIHLRVAELNKFLRPDSIYYSNVDLPTSTTLYEDPAFLPSYKNIVIDGDMRKTMDSLTIYEHNRAGERIDTSVIAPALRLHLDKNFFQQRILDMQGSSVLASNINFIQNFNGITLETNSTDGAIYSFLLATDVSTLTIYYKNEDTDDEGELTEPQEFDLKFDASYVKVNKFDFDRTSAHLSLVQQLDPSYDTTKGSNMLFLQGISGTQADIKLFTDEFQLDSLRSENLLINEASIVYRVSNDNGNSANSPYQLLMVNRDSIDNGGYYTIIDQDYNSAAFGGSLRNDSRILSGENRYYKFRITHLVNSLLNGRLVTTEDGQEVVYGDNFPIKLVPISGADSPARVMLNSNLSSLNANGDSDLYLEIIYSKKE